MKSLNVYTVRERKPLHGEVIFVWGTKYAYDSNALDPHMEKIEYSWVIVDEDGDTGNQVMYEPNEKMPSDCRLAVIGDRNEMEPDDMYSLPDDIFNLFRNRLTSL